LIAVQIFFDERFFFHGTERAKRRRIFYVLCLSVLKKQMKGGDPVFAGVRWPLKLGLLPAGSFSAPKK
jgi:hypothetical protein